MHRYPTVKELREFLTAVPDEAECWAYNGDEHQEPGLRICEKDKADGTYHYRYFATPYPIDTSGSVR